jgi:hypothetical protein
LGLVPPHSLQVNTDFSLAMGGYYCMKIQIVLILGLFVPRFPPPLHPPLG